MARSRIWWLYLFGTCALAVLVLALPAYRAWREYLSTRFVEPLPVAAGESVEYAGGRWRLLESAVEPLPEGYYSNAGLPPPEQEWVYVRARFELVRGPAMDQQTLNLCQIQASDRSDRVWSGTNNNNKLPSDCGSGSDASYREIQAEVGKPWIFERNFRVPADVAKEVRPEIKLLKQQPHFLRFTR